jgi:hypothetical protein
VLRLVRGLETKVTLKTASLLAMIGASLSALYALWNLFSNLARIAQGVLPPVIVFSSLIHAFASITLAIFLFVYYSAQK